MLFVVFFEQPVLLVWATSVLLCSGSQVFHNFGFDILASAVMATLASTVKTIVVELEIDWGHWSMRDVLRKAGEVHGIESAGLTASQMAECSLSELCSADAISDVQSTSSASCGRCVTHQRVKVRSFRMTVTWWPTVCRRKDRCCQPETPVCDLTVWCDFIVARHASITRECSRAEREGSTHVGHHTVEHEWSTRD